ncbi:hypothetical protein Tco_0828239 [Tanacetum coccineum]
MSPLAPRALVFSTSPNSPIEPHPYLASLDVLLLRSSNTQPQSHSQGLFQTLPLPTPMDFEPSLRHINLSNARISAQPEPFLSREQVLHQLNQYQDFDRHIEEAIQNAQQVRYSLIPPNTTFPPQMSTIPPFRTSLSPSSTFVPLDQSLWTEGPSIPPPQEHTLRLREGPSPSPALQNINPKPQALGTTFEARIRDYMAAHSERMEIFENAIFKQCEEINGGITEMFRLLKELMTSKALEKVLIREEAKFPVTKNVNSISLARREEEKNDKTDETLNNTKKPTVTENGNTSDGSRKELDLMRRSLEVLRKFHWMILGGRFNQLSHSVPFAAKLVSSGTKEPALPVLQALVFSTSPNSPIEPHPYLASLDDLSPRSSNPQPQSHSQGLFQTLPLPTPMDFESSLRPINLSNAMISAQPEPFRSREQVLHQLNQYQDFDHHIKEAIQNA